MADEKENKLKTNYTKVTSNYDVFNSRLDLGFSLTGSLYSDNPESDSVTMRYISGSIALAPVLPNLVGKRPTKGVEQYGNFDSQLRCSISPDNANKILKAIDVFLKPNSTLQYVSINLYPGTDFEFGYADGYDMVNQPKNIGNSLYLGIIQSKDNAEEFIYHLMLESDVRVGYKEVEGKTTLDDYLIKDSFFDSFKKFLEKVASYDMQANIAVNSFNSKLYGSVVGSTKSAQSDRTRHTTSPSSRRPSRKDAVVNTYSSDEVADDNVDEFMRRINGGNNIGEDVDVTLDIPTDKVEKPKSLRPSIDINSLDDSEPDFEND